MSKYFSAILIIMLLLITLGCSQNQASIPIPTPTIYTPKYTADYVIYIARSQYPVCFKGLSREVQAPTSINVQYIGGTRTAWSVKITCPVGYYISMPAGITYSLELYFYEDTGKLVTKAEDQAQRVYIKDLRVSPSQIESGNKATITVIVENIGSEKESLDLAILVDGRKQIGSTMFINPNSIGTVDYDITIYEVGNHNISVGTIAKNLFVSAKPITTTPFQTPTFTPTATPTPTPTPTPNTPKPTPIPTPTPTPTATPTLSDTVIANFTGNPRSGQAPLTVRFTDLSEGQITNWNWIFGDGTTSTERNPSHTYTRSGTYSVELHVSILGQGKTDIISIPGYITVTEPRQVADFTVSPATGYAPLKVYFTNLSKGEINSVTWDFGDGESEHTSEILLHFTHTFVSPGSYSVKLTVSGPYGSSVKTIAINVGLLQYKLTVSSRLVGSSATDFGSVTINPIGGLYKPETEVTLTAIPLAGYEFKQWSGDVSNQSLTITVTMDSDKNIFANFIVKSQ